MRDVSTLTIRHAQEKQPWNVPYSDAVTLAAGGHVGFGELSHLMTTHIVLHAMKSLGKLAAPLEAADHLGHLPEGHTQIFKDMAADLMTAALRLANLHGFDLAAELVGRVEEKNGATYPAWEGQ